MTAGARRDVLGAMSRTERQPAACGSWPSSITAQRIVGESTPIEEAAIDNGTIYWTERRPQERGRTTLLRQREGGVTEELTPAPFNVRSRVHEYGGGAFSVGPCGIFCCAFDDQQIYRIAEGRAPEAITVLAGMRFADAIQDALRNRLIAIREDHTREGDTREKQEATNTLVAIDLATGRQSILAHGHDFYSSPALSPDGGALAWLSWDHPNMPWDGSDLWLSRLDADGNVSSIGHIAGGREESIFQPQWSPDGVLHFISDRSGWWNLYRVREGSIEAMLPMSSEFGVPQWTFGMRTYGFDARGDVIAGYTSNSQWNLARISSTGGSLDSIATTMRVIRRAIVDGDTALLLGGGPTTPEQLVTLDLRSGRQTVIRASSSVAFDPALVSKGEPISFPTTGGLIAHANYYAPTNPAHVPRDGELPPLIVMSHGGPTSSATASFSWNIQFWTSRGFAVVDVNYGGSSGYGRAYRQRLNGQWGVVDVDDAVNAARSLVERKAVDGDRVAIRGGSAGGYTTLSALAFRDFFKAGASHYGIGDLESLARDTHKFESRYLDTLIGPYPARRDLYVQRSPIHHTDRLSAPMILFQGSEDKAVPPNQAEAMYEAVRAKGLAVAYILFEGEGHGFRRAENIARAMEAELYFYGKIFGFTPADSIAPVTIDNLPA